MDTAFSCSGDFSPGCTALGSGSWQDEPSDFLMRMTELMPDRDWRLFLKKPERQLEEDWSECTGVRSSLMNV